MADPIDLDALERALESANECRRLVAPDPGRPCEECAAAIAAAVNALPGLIERVRRLRALVDEMQDRHTQFVERLDVQIVTVKELLAESEACPDCNKLRAAEAERDALRADHKRNLESWSNDLTLCLGERDALRARVERLEGALREVRDGYDCDEDAHRYGTRCRCCIARAALEDK